MLARQAEILQLRMPVQIVDDDAAHDGDASAVVSKWLDSVNVMSLDNKKNDLADEDYFTAPFAVDRQEQ